MYKASITALAFVSAQAATLRVGIQDDPDALDPAHGAGTLADIATLSAIADALDVLARYKIGGATLVDLAAPTARRNLECPTSTAPEVQNKTGVVMTHTELLAAPIDLDGDNIGGG